MIQYYIYLSTAFQSRQLLSIRHYTDLPLTYFLTYKSNVHTDAGDVGGVLRRKPLSARIKVLPAVDSMMSGMRRTTACMLTFRLLVGRGTQTLMLQCHVCQLIHVHVPADRVSRRRCCRTTCKIRPSLITLLPLLLLLILLHSVSKKIVRLLRLAIIFTYTVWLRQFLAQMMPRK